MTDKRRCANNHKNYQKAGDFLWNGFYFMARKFVLLMQKQSISSA